MGETKVVQMQIVPVAVGKNALRFKVNILI